jgi:hypothetical protein
MVMVLANTGPVFQVMNFEEGAVVGADHPHVVLGGQMAA